MSGEISRGALQGADIMSKKEERVSSSPGIVQNLIHPVEILKILLEKSPRKNLCLGGCFIAVFSRR